MKKLMSIVLSALMAFCMMPTFALSAFAEIIDENVQTSVSTETADKESSLLNLQGSGDIEITSDAEGFNRDNTNLFVDGSDEYTVKVKNPDTEGGTEYRWTLYKIVDGEQVDLNVTEYSTANQSYTITQNIISNNIYDAEQGENSAACLKLEARVTGQQNAFAADYATFYAYKPSTDFSYDIDMLPMEGVLYDASYENCFVMNTDFRDGTYIAVTCEEPTVKSDTDNCVYITERSDGSYYINTNENTGEAVLECGYSYKLGEETVNRTAYMTIHVNSYVVEVQLNAENSKYECLPGDSVTLAPSISIRGYDAESGQHYFYTYGEDLGDFKVKSLKLVENYNSVNGEETGESIFSNPKLFRENGVKKWKITANEIKDDQGICKEGVANYELEVEIETPDGDITKNIGSGDIYVRNDYYIARFKGSDGEKNVYPGEVLSFDDIEVVRMYRDDTATGEEALKEEILDSSAVNITQYIDPNDTCSIDNENRTITVRNNLYYEYPHYSYILVKGSFNDGTQWRDFEDEAQFTVNGYELEFEYDGVEYDNSETMTVRAVVDNGKFTPDNDEVEVETALKGADGLEYNIKYEIFFEPEEGSFIDDDGNIIDYYRIGNPIYGDEDGSLELNQAALKEIYDACGSDYWDYTGQVSVLATAVETDSEGNETGRILGTDVFLMSLSEPYCGFCPDDWVCLPTQYVYVQFDGQSYFVNSDYKEGAYLDYQVLDVKCETTEGDDNLFSVVLDSDCNSYKVVANVKKGGTAYDGGTGKVTVSYRLEGELKTREAAFEIKYAEENYQVFLDYEESELLNGQSETVTADVDYAFYDTDSKSVVWKSLSELEGVTAELVAIDPDEADESDLVAVSPVAESVGTWNITATKAKDEEGEYKTGRSYLVLNLVDSEGTLLGQSDGWDTVYVARELTKLFYTGNTESTVDVYKATEDERSFEISDFAFKTATVLDESGNPNWQPISDEETEGLSFGYYDNQVFSLIDGGTTLTVKGFDTDTAKSTYLPCEYSFEVITNAHTLSAYYDVTLTDNLLNLTECNVDTLTDASNGIALSELKDNIIVRDSEDKVVDPGKYTLYFCKKGDMLNSDIGWGDVYTIDEIIENGEAGTYYVNAYCGDENKTPFNVKAGSKYITSAIKIKVTDPDNKTTISLGSGKAAETCAGTDFVTEYNGTNVTANQTILPAIIIFDDSGEYGDDNVTNMITDGLTLETDEDGTTYLRVSADTLTKLGKGEMTDINGNTVRACTDFLLYIGVFNNPEEGQPSLYDEAKARGTTFISCKHILEHHEIVESTCCETGCEEYWECTECGKLFKDENCTEECKAEDLVILKKSHDWVDKGITKEAALDEPGEIEYRCKNCKTKRTDTYTITADIDTSKLSNADITQDLKDANFATVDAIKEKLTEETKKQSGFANADTTTVEAELLVSSDNGRNYETADENNTPAGGAVVTLAYPSGTSSANNFIIVHMFDTDVYGEDGTTPIHKAGDTEVITDITKTEEGLQFKLSSASPIQIAYTEPAGAQSLLGLLTGYDGTSAVKFELTDINDESKKYSFSSTNGCYEFKGLALGNYKLTVSADGDYVARDYNINVLDQNENVQDVTLCQLGDTNCDGVRTAEDITRLARHVAKISEESDSYKLQLFNTDRSSESTDLKDCVRAEDITRLARFVAKIIDVL